MRTVKEVSELTGVSIRALHYYDRIGLLHPAMVTEAGYRLYDDTALERLQQILLFRELEFSLKEIRKILDSPDFDRRKALEQQIELLTLKKERLEGLIDFAREIKEKEVERMDFTVFDTKKMDEYAERARKQWGSTESYAEYEKKSVGRGREEEKQIRNQLMQLFVRLGEMKDKAPDDGQVQSWVKELQDYITEHFYTCTPRILASLGASYVANGEFTQNINRYAGEGTAQFASEAIARYCGEK